MIYNIFKKINKREKEVKKPRIIIDIHEKNSTVISNLHELGAEIQITNLKVGDYLINDIIIERKTFPDFISSMISRRLLEQLKNMSQYDKRIIILEGKPNKIIMENSKLNPNSIRGMILATELDFKTPIIQTENEKETAQYLLLLAKKQRKIKTELTLHGRIPKTKEEQKLYVLESIPNIGPKTAKKLLNKFQSIKNIVNAKYSELENFMGKKTKNLQDLLS
jgi:Fanconi anemia group M protein